jgi:hypothetical protein
LKVRQKVGRNLGRQIEMPGLDCVENDLRELKDKILDLSFSQRWQFIFWDVMTYIRMKVNRHFGRTYLLQFQDQTVSQEEASMKKELLHRPFEATCSSESSDDFHLTTRRYILEYRTL